MSELARRESEPEQNPDSLQPEHLAEGFRPIIACVGRWKDYGDQTQEIQEIHDDGLEVNFRKRYELRDDDFRHAGEKTYVISPLNERSKFTTWLCDCTSLVAVGQDKETGQQISFLTHQGIGKLSSELKDKFTDDLKDRLEEIKNRCLPKSIDIVITGGHLHYDGDSDKYAESVELLDNIVNKTMDFHPEVICGPKDGGYDEVYFDTMNKRLHVVRPDEEDAFQITNEAIRADRLVEIAKKHGIIK